MKNNLGEEWTKQDYVYAILTVLLVIVAICIPAGIVIGFDWLTDYKYHWYAWTIMFVGITLFNFWLILRKRPKHNLSMKGNI